MTGTVVLTGGSLSLTTSGSLAWAGALTGTSQSLVDTTAADQQYTVNDATGSGAGWHVTIAATTFTNSPTQKFPDTGTFSTNRSTAGTAAATIPPSATCSAASPSCTLPNDAAVTYPVAITAAATPTVPVTIYDAALSTGLGSIVIGNTPNPVGWWVSVPANAVSGSYTSTILMTVISGP